MGRTVSVFGGSAPEAGSPAYQEAQELGRLLAEAGHTVMTGGYTGTMEAASRGASEAGGLAIGVTVAAFERAGRKPNAYNGEIVRYETLTERLLHLVTRCNAAVALPGGVGTLSEVALTWSLLQTGGIEPMPFVLLGEQWHDLLHTLYADGQYIAETDMHLFAVARTPEQAVTLIRSWE